ncbi:hypothetical protein FQP90_21405 [Paenarthrobacter nitroguajacolicus]|uniref:Cardiolipin synthase N-terminal domain-containing protein n=1 Tax=Paenarthrobacter nitroguajacolicus TaxID=211146 RepID=A0A558GNG2_PAENT|nr:hypothetical protein FQP90_21405 [Paenarthrobacter nitroguajacolicus]
MDSNSEPQLPAAFEIIPWGVCLLYIALLIAALVTIHRGGLLSATERLVWTLIVIFLPIFGAILWFVFFRSKRRSRVSS